MKRIPIPPTKYDPMRPVQAKLAAPVRGPGIGIPPTKYGQVPVQRMAAPSVHLAPGRGSAANAGKFIQRAAAKVSLRTFASDLIADKIGPQRLEACKTAPVYIGKDELLAAKLEKDNIYCLAVYLKLNDSLIKDKSDIAKLNKKFLMNFGLKRVDVNVLGFDASQAYLAEDGKKVDEIRGTTEEVVFLLKGGYAAAGANKLVHKKPFAAAAAATAAAK